MGKEINNHTSHKHWTNFELNSVLCGQILRSTWTFRINRNSSTNEIIKFKDRFYTDGRRQELCVNTMKHALQLINLLLCELVLHYLFFTSGTQESSIPTKLAHKLIVTQAFTYIIQKVARQTHPLDVFPNSLRISAG